MLRFLNTKTLFTRTTLLCLIIIVFVLVSYVKQYVTSNNGLNNWKQAMANPTVLSLLYSSSVDVSYSDKYTEVEVTVNTTIKPTVEPKLLHKMGHVNVHVWYKICARNIDSLRQNPLFPLWPGVRGQPEMPDELLSIMSDRWSAQRVMGLLHPPHSGDYRFQISSTAISEFWLSTSRNPVKAALLARNSKNYLHGVGFDMGVKIPTSKPVHLDHGKVYYFEIIHGMNDLWRDQVQVRWMLPSAKDFTAIPKSSLSTVLLNDNNHDVKERHLLLQSASLMLQAKTPKTNKPHTWNDTNFSKPFDAYPSYTRENVHTLQFANSTKIMSAFKDCDYSPSYTVKDKKLGRYEGIYYTHFSHVFPDDDTDNKIWDGFHVSDGREGNTLIKEHVVVDIVKTFMAQLEVQFPRKYLLTNVVNVERNVDVQRGSRFLLELVLLEVHTKELQRVSEYVYRFKDGSTLCKPKGFKWSPTVKINVIITAKSQGPWVVHYIKNMAQVLNATHDQNVHFIIVDFNNGVEVEDELRRNGVKKYTLIKKKGKFYKTLAIDEATRSIKDNNSIVFLTDLHLDVPNNIFESVRKHTIRGIMGFTPVLFRLTNCGRPDTNQATSTGFWENYGYGVFSAYKSDWENFGGVNVKDFKYSWGGEDSEMIDRVLSKGYEIERLRLPYFYHYYHDKEGMWKEA